MRVHCVKHVQYEGLGSIAPWLSSRGHAVSTTEVYPEARFPEIDDFDWLIVMGGAMGAGEEDVYPWLGRERDLIAEAIASGKVVLGVCLGAQMIAGSLGAKVYRSREPEIGWFRVDLLDGAGAGGAAGALAGLPGSIEAFHWHGDTFDLPHGARRLARSDGCENQAFSLGRRVLGLQFHLEITPATVNALIENNRDRPLSGKYVQAADEMRRDATRYGNANNMMATVLENLANSPA